MSELAAGLAASANEPVAETTTIDAALDAAFDTSPEPAASSEPSGTPEPAHEPVAATQQPQEPAKPETQTGEPPKERWDSILANARTKAREEALAEHRDALEIVNRLRSDFSGTLTQLLDEGIADQRFADTLTTKAAAILAARRQQAKQDEMPQPDQGDDKYVWYSPEQQKRLDDWKARQIKSELLNEFKPLLELKQQVEQSRERQQQTEQALSIASERGAQWKQMPFFEDHKTAILERQQALYAELEAQGKQGGRFDAVNAPWIALQQAYREVVTAQALPKLQAQQTQQMVDSAARKRAGSASDPAAAAPAQPRKPRTVDEALDQVFSAVAI